MKNSLLIILTLFYSIGWGQDNDHLVLKQTIMDLLEEEAENEGSNQNYFQLAEKIEELLQHPLNINEALYEDFLNCLIFSDDEIQSIIRYRDTYTQFLELDELKATGAFTEKKYRIINPLLTITTTDQPLSKYTNHQLLWRAKWKPNLEEYQGAETAQLLKYQFDNQSLGMGLTIEQDHGEPLDKTFKKSPYVDFLSGYIRIKKPIKHVKQVILGDYALQTGQGLLFWNSFAMGGAFYNINTSRSAPVLLPYKSVNEHNFLRGVSSELVWKKLHLYPFLSYKQLNATASDNTFSTVYQDGLHRTPGELNRKYSTSEVLTGITAKWSKRSLALGGAIAYSSYGKEFTPSFTSSSAKENLHVSLDYKLFFKHLHLSGEMASRNMNTLATIHNLNITPSPKTELHLSYRYYGQDYYSLYENAYKSFSRANNESGIYTGINYYISTRFSLTVFADWYQNITNSPSRIFPTRGTKKGAQLQFNETEKLLVYLRWTSKEIVDYTGKYDQKQYLPVKETKQNVRFDITYAFSEMIKIRTRAEYADFEKGTEDGYLFFQDFYHKITYRLKYNLRLAYFHTTDFDAAIYAYESDVLYAFNTTAYFEKGMKYYINLGYSLGRHLDFWLRASTTHKPTYYEKRYNDDFDNLWEVNFQLRLLY